MSDDKEDALIAFDEHARELEKVSLEHLSYFTS